MLKRIVKSATALGFAATVFTASAPISLADSNISTQGPDSGITASWSNKQSVSNDNDVSVTNSNCQTATSGSATVSGNTTGGSATSGSASNNNSVSTSVSVSNALAMSSLGGQGSMSTLGPNSPISSSFSNYAKVKNSNDVYVSSYNRQFAMSGSATVSGNTTGGSATSGSANNNNSSSTQVSINNGGQGGGSGGKGGGPGGQGGQGGGTVPGVGGKGGGQVLGATFTVASLGGGMGAAQLPNTGLHQGLDPWIAITILTLLASGVYLRYAIMPKLKSQ